MKYDVNSPLAYWPIPNDEFYAQLERQIQESHLSNPIDVIRHHQAMERDAHKSALRQAEYLNKMQLKERCYEILETRERVFLTITSGGGNVITQRTLFNLEVLDVLRFQRLGIEGNYWQVVLQVDNRKIYSMVYPEEYLRSASKMQRTILTEYDATIAAGDKSIAWRWLRNKLTILYESAKVILLPYYAGWFLSNGVWHFWTKSEETGLLAGDIINRFTMKEFENLSAREIADELIAEKSGFSEKTSQGILMIYRFLSLLARLETDSPPPMGLTIIGDNAVEIAKAYLRTMDCGDKNYDIANLDADRIGLIRENVRNLQDTPIIFTSCNADNKSTTNRILKVVSWMETGYVEGKKVAMPFIFCLQKFSPIYPLDHTVIIITEGIASQRGSTAFDRLQSLVISMIEDGGLYWANEFRQQYKAISEELTEGFGKSVVSAGRAMISTILRMMNLDEEKE